jgi:hypothetical protein
MRELILSDITVMGQGYCVIGIERLASGAFRSIRPFPPSGFAWREPFPWRRGDYMKFHGRPIPVARPHVEDVQSFVLDSMGRSLGEDELVECLKQAEVSPDLEHLFGCPVQASSAGGRALWVSPSEAARSVCGCGYVNLRFRLFPEPAGFNLRAEVTLSSNERLASIPVVDREWRRFASQLFQRIQRSDALAFAERFLNGRVRNALLLASTRQFVRVGLPRPREDRQCWLMLDSLFPQPDESWLDLL